MAIKAVRKYGNKKIIYDGIEFDSKREANRYAELKLMQRAGKIHSLELQKDFELLPAQYEPVSREDYANSKGKKTKGKCIERAVKYKADFVYIQDGRIVVEDTKGFKTKDYILKRKMMLYFYGIRIVEI